MSEKRVERRLAAILAADVVGYSRLMGTDEAGTLARLKAYRRELIDPHIGRHKGRIVKTTGDGLLIDFASIVDAVQCAMTVQTALAERNAEVPSDQRIEFRIGINLGDIIIDEDDIFGDGVNIAARLEALADPGGICVNRVVRDQVRDKLDITFEDMGEQQVKNIARPVRAFRVLAEGRPVPEPSGPRPVLALPDKPSIAVLPFQNISGDPEQEYFADGIAEDVITALSRYPSLFVIARNSTFSYKGRAVETRQVGRELGVRYVLEGSLRKAGNRIRVTAQLIEAETGNHVWAERYDRDLADIFAVQDEISEAATIAIAPVIAQAERQRAMRKPPNSLDAWAAYQRGLWHMSKATAEDTRIAEGFFRQTVDLDPAFAGGYGGLASALNRGADTFGLRPTAEVTAICDDLARRAVAIDSRDPEVRVVLSGLLRMHGDVVGAAAEAERALAMSPNLGAAHQRRGEALICMQRAEEGIAALETSVRLDPRSAWSAPLLNFKVIGFYFSKQYAAALEAAEIAIRTFPDYPHPYRWRAAALGQLGRVAEAKIALAKAIAIAPGPFDIYVRNRIPWLTTEDNANMLEGLRKAGWEG